MQIVKGLLKSFRVAGAIWFVGAEGGEGVQHSDGPVDEAVSQSAGSGPEAEEAVGGMGGVTHRAECFVGQACAVTDTR